MSKLNQLGITIGANNKAEAVFDSLFPSFLEVKYKKPSDYIATYWDKFQKHPDGNNNLNGKIFEYILATLCVRENILPLWRLLMPYIPVAANSNLCSARLICC